MARHPDGGMEEERQLGCSCRECGLPYEDLGLDITLPDDQWLMIHPEGGGILCGSCIAKRAAFLPRAIALRAYIEFAPAIKVGRKGERERLGRIAKALLTALMERMRFRSPLPEEGWAVEKLTRALEDVLPGDEQTLV